MKFFVLLVIIFAESFLTAIATKEPGKTLEETQIYFNAAEDTYHQFKPFATPISAGYFSWKCRLVYMKKSQYLCWNYQLAPLRNQTKSIDQITKHLEKTTKYYGFAFEHVSYANANLPEHTQLIVIGRYTTNAIVSLKNGEEQLVPVLSDVYVFKSPECNTYDCKTQQQDPLLFQNKTYQQVIEKKFPLSMRILNRH